MIMQDMEIKYVYSNIKQNENMLLRGFFITLRARAGFFRQDLFTR